MDLSTCARFMARKVFCNTDYHPLHGTYSFGALFLADRGRAVRALESEDWRNDIDCVRK